MRASVRLIRSGERAPAQGKKRKSSACAPTDCKYRLAVWMLALMERTLVAAYTLKVRRPSPSRGLEPVLLCLFARYYSTLPLART